MDMKSPGLKARPRADGSTAYYWVASAISRDTKDYPLKTVRLHGDDEEILARCRVLTSELKQWLADSQGFKPEDEGTLRHLIRLYQQTPESPYHRVKSNTRVMYDEALGILERSVGTRRLAMLTGLDFIRWFDNLRQPALDTPALAVRRAEAAKQGIVLPPNPERHRRAYKAMQLLRIVIKFGVVLNNPECFRLNTILSTMDFSAPKARTKAITYEQAKAICVKAAEEGLLSIAIAQALQFDLTLRQIDVIGRWEKVEPEQGGGIVDRGQRWVDGLLWSHIDENGILKKETSKTGQAAEHDTNAYPMLRGLLAKVPSEKRIGPVVKSERTGLPYRRRHFAETWRALADASGVPSDVWNRDSRAGGVTEGSDAGADIEHLRHHANHKNIQTTTRYNRATLEKTRQVAELRVAKRGDKNTPGTSL